MSSKSIQKNFLSFARYVQVQANKGEHPGMYAFTQAVFNRTLALQVIFTLFPIFPFAGFYLLILSPCTCFCTRLRFFVCFHSPLPHLSHSPFSATRIDFANVCLCLQVVLRDPTHDADVRLVAQYVRTRFSRMYDAMVSLKITLAPELLRLLGTFVCLHV